MSKSIKLRKSSVLLYCITRQWIAAIEKHTELFLYIYMLNEGGIRSVHVQYNMYKVDIEGKANGVSYKILLLLSTKYEQCI